MTKSSKYSLIALVVLAVFTIGIGVYYFSSQKTEKSVTASADTLSGSSGTVAIYPLKIGWNELRNGSKNMSLNSNVIDAGGSKISLAEAQTLEIITQVKMADGSILGNKYQIVAPLDKFEVYVNSISQSPKFVPER